MLSALDYQDSCLSDRPEISILCRTRMQDPNAGPECRTRMQDPNAILLFRLRCPLSLRVPITGNPSLRKGSRVPILSWGSRF